MLFYQKWIHLFGPLSIYFQQLCFFILLSWHKNKEHVGIFTAEVWILCMRNSMQHLSCSLNAINVLLKISQLWNKHISEQYMQNVFM